MALWIICSLGTGLMVGDPFRWLQLGVLTKQSADIRLRP